MDATLQKQFERIEAALNTLVDSITTYNPSPQAAIELLAADDELSNGLSQLSQHQANHARILTLRAEADRLEAQLKSNVGTLADLRRELFETPTTTFPEDYRAVPFTELLEYAQNISKYTVPPTYREPIAEEDAEDTKDGGTSGTQSADQGTPTNGATAAPAVVDSAANEDVGEDASKEEAPQEAEWYKKLREVNHWWVPWPADGKIRAGNLGLIQVAKDMGKDPWFERARDDPYVREKLGMEVELQKQKEEFEQQQADQHQQAMQAQHQQPVQEQVPGAAHNAPPAQPRQAGEPRVFQGFDDFDDE